MGNKQKEIIQGLEKEDTQLYLYRLTFKGWSSVPELVSLGHELTIGEGNVTLPPHLLSLQWLVLGDRSCAGVRQPCDK